MSAFRNTLIGCLGAVSMVAGAHGATLVPIPSVQNSSSTLAFGINDSNVIAGGYVSTQDGIEHAFFGPLGSYTSFDAGSGGTEARSINNNGYITGHANSQNGDTATEPMFVRLPGGKLLNVEANGQQLYGRAQGINNSNNAFAGTYWDFNDHESVAFVGRKGKFHYDVLIPKEHQASDGEGINSHNLVVGSYFQPPEHGFIGSGNNLQIIDYPAKKAAGTSVDGINDHGQAVGQWQDTSGNTHSFVLDIATNTYTEIKVPGSKNVEAWSINNAGAVVLGSDLGPYVWCAKASQCP